MNSNKLINKGKDFFTKGEVRSVKAKINILYMLFIKGANILMGFFLVPMTLNYVDSEKYGIWMAISSMVCWISFFDIGINNGLKNNLTIALSNGDKALAKKYVSTTYAILCFIFLPLMIIMLSSSPFINWMRVMNLSQESAEGLLATICITIVYFCLNFILSTINVVLMADQRPADSAFRNLIQQAVTLILIFIFTKTTHGSLVNLCICQCISPLIVITLFNFTLFKGRYKEIAPSLRSIDFSVAPQLVKLGLQFFIIQIASIIQYQMINFIILRYYGGTEVTAYSISFKLFSAVNMVWSILTTPLWAAFTEAIAKRDTAWIRRTIKKYLLLLTFFIVGGVILLVASPWIFKIWIGDTIHISFVLSLCVFCYQVICMFNGIFISFINGSGYLKQQSIAALFSPIVFLGCCSLFISLGFPIHFVVVASILSNFYGPLIAPFQTYRIINNLECRHI